MLASESALLAAVVTAFMKAARTPAFSNSCTPAIVVPATDQSPSNFFALSKVLTLQFGWVI